MMPPLDTLIFQFDIWETLDEESMELAQTSEFLTQMHYEAERLDIVPPADDQDLLDSDSDWRVIDTPEEEEHEHKDNIVHHDCMWAGSCGDSVHPSNTFVPTDLTSASPGQSLLRRDLSPARPDTPPSLDGDEAPQFRHTVDFASTAVRLLNSSDIVASDHSYTYSRPTHIDHLGVQTPSDSCESEEEIDVVSVGTSTQQPLAGATQVRTLPCTPSVAERRELQRTVAHAIEPRGRKRAAGGRRRARGARRGRRAHTDSDSEAESPELERRSIHNDMERQRRIGLKNLFDDLKMQIPATRDKDRAPKVVILREAASLCRKLRAEDAEWEHLNKQQAKLKLKLRKLRTMMRSARYRSY